MICPETHTEQSLAHFLIDMMKELDESIEEQVQELVTEIEEMYS
jgi:hypothetical protein